MVCTYKYQDGKAAITTRQAVLLDRACGQRYGPGGDAHSELLSRQAYGGECKYVLTPPRLA